MPSELIVKVLTGVLRVLLLPILTWLIDHGILTSDESLQLVAEIASYVIVVGWAIWSYIRHHRAEMTALAMPKGSTLADLKDQMHSGAVASALTPTDQAPIIVPKEGK